jgi:hypothetical protein
MVRIPRRYTRWQIRNEAKVRLEGAKDKDRFLSTYC